MQPGQRIGHVGGQQIAPGGQQLPELDEHRAERDQGIPQSLAARLLTNRPQAQRQDAQQDAGRQR
ncbi:MAG: hypothetical protein ACKOZX_10860 [Gammaproteobacteria bacterium]